MEAARALGRSNERLVVFNSLSKRSSAPGLRSGFVAGDREIVAKFLLYRTYHGAAPGLNVQVASVAAWSDEAHVEENRAKYQAKFRALDCVKDKALRNSEPSGGFFLWVPLGADDERFARELYESRAIVVLPGTYLGREVGGANPGRGYVRVAMVPEVEACTAALDIIEDFVEDEFIREHP